MKNTKSESQTINKLLMKESSIIYTELNSITDTLVELTDKDLIESFSYARNIEDSIFGNKQIRINVNFKETGTAILGLLDNIKNSYSAPKSMGDEIHKKLAEINEYLLFVNKHLNDHIPEISVTTYYSKKALTNDGGWKDEKPVILYPDFVNKKIKTNKPF